MKLWTKLIEKNRLELGNVLIVSWTIDDGQGN